VAEEFKAMVDDARVAQRESALRQYLLEYPSARLPNATSFLYWHKVSFGLKPTIMINHVVIMKTPQRALIVIRSTAFFSLCRFRTDAVPRTPTERHPN
jgi:hypothetical protein